VNTLSDVVKRAWEPSAQEDVEVNFITWGAFRCWEGNVFPLKNGRSMRRGCSGMQPKTTGIARVFVAVCELCGRSCGSYSRDYARAAELARIDGWLVTKQPNGDYSVYCPSCRDMWPQ
jgi:hypothetical protein